MKRPPGIWFLLSAGVLWLSINNVYGLKATEIIFRKTTSTSTTTTEAPVSSEQPVEGSTEAASEAANVTKSLLTGIPQIDYIYDPNLPRELNGYNLSSYPFYNALPDNITFKCDGLHDGFYASIPHKCQVYHHCISGTRYDFLCANYTAFDQTIFNCHFVSEVDCDNSQKFWHRNDALYISASSTTTTIQPTPIVISPALTGSPKRPPPPIGRRRPSMRRRPAYEYYDDEYADDDREDYYEPPILRRRKKRPRPRPRPIYDDDDDEEYEDRHERRGSGRRNDDRRREYDNDDKRSYDKPTDRRVNEEKQDRHNEGRRHEYEDDDRRLYKKPIERRPSEDKEKHNDDRQRDYEDEDRRLYETSNDKRTNNNKYDRHHDHEDGDKRLYEKPSDKEMDEDKEFKYNDKRKPYNDRRYKDDRRHEYEEEDYYNHRRPSMEKRRPYHERPTKPQRRPYDDGFYDTDKEEKSDQTEPPKTSKTFSNNDGIALVKPQGPSSVYNQPRMPPRIKPPMPKSSLKTTSTEKPVTIAKPVDDTEYYDDYEDEVQIKITTNKVPETSKQPKFYTTLKPHLYVEEYADENPPVNSVPKILTEGSEKVIDTHYTSPKFFPKESKHKIGSSTIYAPTSTISTTRITTTTELPKERTEPVVRVVKRPFLPSRGGNPYSIRGLQPVGAKALDTSKYESELPDITEKYETSQPPIQNDRQFPKAFQVKQAMVKQQTTNKPSALLETAQKDLSKPQILPPSKFIPKVEERPRNFPKAPVQNPLDINENEYDVTLNDALNPTIPNLPIRNFPTGFGLASADYLYNTFQRPRYDGYNIPPESFQPKTIKQRDETIVAQSQTYRNPVYVNRNFRPNLQITQANAHGFYSPF